MSKLLGGLRVLELGQVLAAPYAGAILADLGADVLKLERVDGGDDSRHMGPEFRHGGALSFHIFNRGKQSVALDLRSPEGREHFESLAAQSDVFIHNLRPGVTQTFGIDGESLCARHPRLIYAEVSAFGPVGPMKMNPGYEPMLQAFSGLSSTNGGPDDPPMRLGASVCDLGTGMWSVIGILAALQRRQVTGRGGLVQASLLETALAWNAQKSDAWLNLGQLPARHRSGHAGLVPYEAFDTADAPILVCCGNDRLFAKLAQVLGHPGWAADPRYLTNQTRLQHRAGLVDDINRLMRQQPRTHWLAAFEAAGVPCAPIHSVQEALAHAQVQALDMLPQVPGDSFQLTALPLVIDGTRPTPRGAGPALGEHNVLHRVTPSPTSSAGVPSSTPSSTTAAT